MKILRLTTDQAEVLVSAWDRFGIFGAIKHAMPPELASFPSTLTVRALVGRANKAASDCLFDGKKDLAVRMFVKYGWQFNPSRSENELRTVHAQLKRSGQHGSRGFKESA